MNNAIVKLINRSSERLQVDNDIIQKLQYGLTSHSRRLRHELHPEEDLFTPDADNAFNTASRAVELHEVQRHFPGALSFLSQMYAHDSRGWIRSRNDIYDKDINKETVWHHGCFV